MRTKKTKARATPAVAKPKAHPKPTKKPGVPPKTITIADEEPMTA